MAKVTKVSGVMQATIYARYSPRPNEAPESLEFQLESCWEFCRKKGWDVSEEREFTDTAMSGSDKDRIGLWQAVGATKKGGVLVVHKLDRLARDTALFCLIESELSSRQARIVSVSGEGTETDTPESKMIRSIVAVIASYQREMTNARTKAMMLSHQAKGRRMSYKIPFGWEIDPDSPLVVVKRDRDKPEGEPKRMMHSGIRVNETEQLIIDRVRELYGLEYSCGQIAKIFESEDIPCRLGKWNADHVYKTLINHCEKETALA